MRDGHFRSLSLSRGFRAYGVWPLMCLYRQMSPSSCDVPRFIEMPFFTCSNKHNESLLGRYTSHCKFHLCRECSNTMGGKMIKAANRALSQECNAKLDSYEFGGMYGNSITHSEFTNCSVTFKSMIHFTFRLIYVHQHTAQCPYKCSRITMQLFQQ